MFISLYQIFQRYFLKELIGSLDKNNKAVNRLGRLCRRIGDEQDSVQKQHLDQTRRIILLEEHLKRLEMQLQESRQILRTYDAKFKEMVCLEKNVDSIFSEIDNVKKYVCKCQNQLIEDISKHNTAFEKIIKNIEISDKSITLRTNNDEVVIFLTKDKFIFGNWCFIVDDDSLSISCSGKNVMKLDSNDPTMCLYKTVDSDYGMSTVTCAEFNLDPTAEKKLRITCNNNDIPDTTTL